MLDLGQTRDQTNANNCVGHFPHRGGGGYEETIKSECLVTSLFTASIVHQTRGYQIGQS